MSAMSVNVCYEVIMLTEKYQIVLIFRTAGCEFTSSTVIYISEMKNIILEFTVQAIALINISNISFFHML